ncbi:MAG: XRE family transcriptional regulator [Clostridia bacterium]|nr:XRE family transcriptional regulator [Clostridia bacterium]
MAKLKEMLEKIRERTTPEQSQFVNDNMEIVDYIYEVMEKKNMRPADLAKALGKTPAEISKWLSGSHNFTLLSLSKIAAVLDETIIITPTQART